MRKPKKKNDQPELKPADDPTLRPTVITLPNTSEMKMKAILAVAEACKDVARALNSANAIVNVTINGSITGGSEHCGLVIGKQPTDIE